MEVVVAPPLLIAFLRHVSLDFVLFELDAPSHLVDFHVQNLVGRFRLGFYDLKLLAMIAYFSHDV